MFLQNLGSFEADLTVALIGSNVPVVIVKDRKAAALEISGRRTQKRGGTFAPEWIEEVTITIRSIESGVVIEHSPFRVTPWPKLLALLLRDFRTGW